MTINMPSNVGEWAHTLLSVVDEDKILFVNIDHEESPPNPCEDMDGMGIMYSFSRKHSNYLKMDYPGTKAECLKKLQKEHGKYIQILGYFEHGQCDWHLSGCRPAGTEGDYSWDGISFAGVWVPDETILAELKKIRGVEAKSEYARKCARQCCEIYTQWCNGEIYNYIVELYKTRKSEDGQLYDERDDYRLDEPLAERSCCSYYGYKSVEEAAIEAAEEIIKEAAKNE